MKFLDLGGCHLHMDTEPLYHDAGSRYRFTQIMAPCESLPIVA